MSRFMRTELFLALSLVATTASCGPGAISKKVQNPALHQTLSLPSQTEFVVGGSFEEFRKTDTYIAAHQLFMDALQQDRDLIELLGRVKYSCEIDFFTDINWGIAVGGDNPKTALAIVLGVNFDEAKANACMSRLALQPFIMGIATYYHDPGVLVTWPSENVIALAFDKEALDFLLEITNGPKDAGVKPKVRSMLANVDPKATVWAVFSDRVVDGIFREFGISDFLSTDATPTSAELSIRLASEVHAMGKVTYAQEADSVVVTKDWQKAISELDPRNPLAHLVPEVDMRTEGTSSIIELTLGEKNTKGLLRLGERIVQAERERRLRAEVAWIAGEADREAEYARQEREEARAAEEAEREAAAAREAKAREDKQNSLARAAAAVREERTKRAKAHSDQGRAYLDASVYDKAVEEFKKANALIAHPDFLYNIAFSYDNQRSQEEKALDYYQQYLAAAPDGVMADVSRRRVAKITKRLRAKNR